jgi:predicted PurR-regulated permease PerM
MEDPSQTKSPDWGNTTKMVIGLTIVGVIALLMIEFRYLIALLLVAFILAYLFYPIAHWMNHLLKIPWRLAVTIIYVGFILIILALLAYGGFSISEQVSNLIRFFQNLISQIPTFLDNLSKQSYSIGPFHINFSSLNLTSITGNLTSLLQPTISRLGSLVTTFASGFVSTLVDIGFLLLISYFTLSESLGVRERVFNIQIPGYEQDINRLGRALNRIWNAFLRGQFLLVLATIAAYMIVLTLLGVHFSIGLAFLAGLARFIPYFGPAVLWITYFLVSLLQGTTVLGLSPIFYAVLVVGIGILVDTSLDYFFVPRLFSNVLKVHPAAVLVTILIAARWLGIIGIVLASPVLATVILFVRYAVQKMVDRDPWETIQFEETPLRTPRIIQFFINIWGKFKSKVIDKLFNKRNKGK